MEVIADQEPKACRVRLGDRGRVVLPSAIRRRMGLHTGDVLVLDQVGDGELRLRVARHVVAELRGSYSVQKGAGFLVADLDRERRAEALREELESRGASSDAVSPPSPPPLVDPKRGP